MKSKQLQAPFRVLSVALALGWVGNVLFYGNSPGISVLIFVLLVLTTLFSLGWLEKTRLMRRNLWLIAPMLFFAIMVFVRANVTLTALNITAIIILFGLLVFFFAADHVERLGLLGYPVVLFLAFGRMLTRTAPAVDLAIETVGQHKQRFRLAIPLVRGLLIAAPILLVFTALLSSADTIFASFTRELLALKGLGDPVELVARTIMILAAAWLLAGSFLQAYNRQRDPTRPTPEYMPGTIIPNRLIGFSEVVIVLALVDMLFLGFAWIQFSFLFSGQAAATMNYAAYRDYVRQGFGELLVTSVLTMLLILGLLRISRPEKSQIKVFNVLSTLMIGLAGVMLVSAFQRMMTWESVEYYINTGTRLYVRLFIIWLGLTFIWLLFTLWLKPNRFAIGAFVAALGFLISINLMNPDADVAQFNLARQDELSTYYLYTLSEDAIPALVNGLDQSSDEIKRRIRLDLANRLNVMEEGWNQSWRGWPAFHLSRSQAYDMLTRLRKTGAIPSH